MSAFMESICCRLLNAEESFLAAIVSGPEAISNFNEEWLSLQNEWEKHIDVLDQDTAELAHAISSRVAIMAESFLDIQTETTSLRQSSMGEIDAILFTDTSSCHDYSLPSRIPTPILSLSPSTWLLQNLHNPYPSTALKTSMESTTASKSVSEWFTWARQRIGWTKVLRDRFDGSRSAAIDAAFRAFIRDDPMNPLDPQVRSEFLAVRTNARRILQTQSIVVDEIDFSHTWNRSRSASPAPSLTLSMSTDDSEDDTAFPASSIGRKRSISQLSEDDSTTFDFRRPSKRHRPSFSSSPSIDVLHISPSLAADAIDGAAATVTPPPRLGKRCFSTADIDGPKRPKGITGRIHHAVSDPIPLSTAESESDDWCQAFQFPPIATTSPPDNPSPWNLDLFDVDSFSNEYNGILPDDALLSNCFPYTNLDFSIPADYNLLTPPSSTTPHDISFDPDWSGIFDLKSSTETSHSTPQDSPPIPLSTDVIVDVPTIVAPPSPTETISSSKSMSDTNSILQAFLDFFPIDMNPTRFATGVNGFHSLCGDLSIRS